ncbi:hypothetical protein DY000_02018058 [Brassica cretica]|uniref:Uncharacterized protein n=1 Tax=Brassica cretica TaxID=69181 RepID=A0ABQ7DBF3_BRACR|nr:hypothetical protein DY000_02018058 [Brassica cretica]
MPFSTTTAVLAITLDMRRAANGLLADRRELELIASSIELRSSGHKRYRAAVGSRSCWSGLRSPIANGSKLLSGRVEQAEIVSRERTEVAS